MAVSVADNLPSSLDKPRRSQNGARLRERSPEKAGVGGSIPSLATTSFERLSATSVLKACLCGVHLESKLGYHSKIALSLLAPIVWQPPPFRRGVWR